MAYFIDLNICLNNIYSPQGETDLDVDYAIELIQNLINTKGSEQSRVLKAVDVLYRISTVSNLSLWYILRHVGFAKENDKIICPGDFSILKTTQILEKLISTREHNDKIRNGDLQATPKYVAPSRQHHTTQMADTVGTGDVGNGMNDNEHVSNNEQNIEQNSTPLNNEQNNASTPTSTGQQAASPTSSEGGGAYTTKVSIQNMTKEEKQAYVAAMMAKKKK